MSATERGPPGLVPSAAHGRPGGSTRDARAQPQVEGRAAADRHVDLHQLRHVHPTLPTAVRGDLQPRDRRHHHPRAVLRVREVHRPVPGRLHLPGPELDAVAGPLVGRADERRPVHVSRTGILCLHGFTGSPRTMQPVSVALDLAGFDISVPCLPGHGTVVEDMLDTRWSDWSNTAEAAYAAVASTHDRVVVVGLSMGGTLAAWLASRHPQIDGVVFFNPMVLPVDPLVQDIVRDMLAAGEVHAPRAGTGGSDIADPDADERAYDETPLAPVLSLFEAVDALQSELPKIVCPVLIMTSVQDHVVDPAASDLLAERVSGPV